MIHTPRGFAYLQHIDRQPRTQRHIRARPLNQPLPPTRARSRIAQLLDIQSSLRSDFVGTSK